jgi:hypothetical protein
MADNNLGPKLAGLRNLQASFDQHRTKPAVSAACETRGRLGLRARRLLRSIGRAPVRSRVVWRIGIACAVVVALIPVALALLWWRLSYGPVPLDIATPWISAAIKENFGTRHRVDVGGTILERDQAGRTAVRIVDIVVRDPDGSVVASAPRAEVGISGSSLLTGRPRAASLKLVDTALSVRIGADGQFTLLPHSEALPLGAAAPSAAAPAPAPAGAVSADASSKSFLSDGPRNFNALLAWIDSMRALGLDGYDLNEIGLKDGRIVVEDERNGQRSVFDNINVSVTRSKAGEVVFSIGSDRPDHQWQLLASVKVNADGARVLNIDAHRIALRDLLLALRVADGQLEAEMPFSGKMHVEISPDGVPRSADGHLAFDHGVILTEPGNKYSRMTIDHAEIKLDWDKARGTLVVPLKVASGDNRFDLVANAQAPDAPGGVWTFGLSRGSIVFAPIPPGRDPLLLDRIVVRGRFDPAKQRIDLDQGEVGGDGLALTATGSLDFSGEPHLAMNMTATPKVSFANFKQLWPVPANPGVRAWALEHFDAGTVEHIEVMTNAPLKSLQPNGPPVADDGMVITVVASGVSVHPVDELPPITEAEVVTRIVGRSTTMTMARGVVDVSPGRRLVVTNGVLEIPDGYAKKPPARARMRVEGPAPAAAELLMNERLREAAGTPLDPAATHGNMTAQVALAFIIDPDDPKGPVNYSINADVTNFAIDRFVMSQRIEAQTLRVAANNQGYQVKGDVRIGGMLSAIDYRKLTSEPDAQFRLQGNFDDAARTKFGFDLGNSISGPVPIKLAGRMGMTPDQESRFTVEADLTQAKIDGLIPGWLKAPGRPTRASFTEIARGKSFRCEDLVIEGSGTSVKGTIEFDDKGEVLSANLPTFALSDGDKVNVKADRASDGQLKVTMRGEVYDGRGFVKSQLSSSSREQKSRNQSPDFDLDAKLGAVAGFNGEAIRALDVRVSRRGGQIRAFKLNGKLGVDTPLTGDLRGRDTGSRQVVYLETNDAGSLFRFTDTYPKMFGGQLWMAMDAPTGDQSPQDGLLNIRDFVVRGESGLDKVVSGAPGGVPNGVQFTRLRVEFTRSPGKLALRDGVVQGPIVGATIDGTIDYTGNDVRLRGTFIPLYGLNNAFGQIPLFGLFLGGPKEGLVGITYQVIGAPGRSVLQINPVSVVAPGIFRKPFEFQDWSADRVPLPDR